MKLTENQKRDLETINYFNVDNGKYTDEDIRAFFDYSEKGIKPKEETAGYKTLLQGKRWRGIHIHEMYEKGVLDGSMPYFVILGGYEWFDRKRWWQFWKKQTHKPIPRSVVDFMKKEMFKGHDSEIIEKVYQDLMENI